MTDQKAKPANEDKTDAMTKADPRLSAPATKPQLSGAQSAVEKAAGSRTPSEVDERVAFAVALVAANPYLSRLKPGEPFFVLRAQDALAPQMVKNWAERAKENHLPTEKYLGAYRVAAEMEKWPFRKMPD